MEMDDRLNTSMESRESSNEDRIRRNLQEMEELEDYRTGIFDNIYSFTYHLDGYFDKRCTSVKESLKYELDSLPWAEDQKMENDIISGCSLDASKEESSLQSHIGSWKAGQVT